MLPFGRSHTFRPLIGLAALALVLVACAGGSGASPGGDIHLRISKAFDNRAKEAELWNSGTITADALLPVAKLDTMDVGGTYDGNKLGAGAWSATTQQQMGDFDGECNGSSDCHPCTATFGGSWDIPSVDFTVQERDNGRYVIKLWLGNDNPPKTGGCDGTGANGPVDWADHLTVTLTGIGSASPAGSADGYTVEVSK